MFFIKQPFRDTTYFGLIYFDVKVCFASNHQFALICSIYDLGFASSSLDSLCSGIKFKKVASNKYTSGKCSATAFSPMNYFFSIHSPFE